MVGRSGRALGAGLVMSRRLQPGTGGYLFRFGKIRGHVAPGDHVVLTIADLDATVRSHTEVLGMEAQTFG